MISKNGKYQFYPNEDDSSFALKIPLMKKCRNYWRTFIKN